MREAFSVPLRSRADVLRLLMQPLPCPCDEVRATMQPLHSQSRLPGTPEELLHGRAGVSGSPPDPLHGRPERSFRPPETLHAPVDFLPAPAEALQTRAKSFRTTAETLHSPPTTSGPRAQRLQTRPGISRRPAEALHRRYGPGLTLKRSLWPSIPSPTDSSYSCPAVCATAVPRPSPVNRWPSRRSRVTRPPTGRTGFFEDEAREAWGELHTAWAESFPRGRAVLTDKSGHNIHTDEPALVLAEITRLLARLDAPHDGSTLKPER